MLVSTDRGKEAVAKRELHRKSADKGRERNSKLNIVDLLLWTAPYCKSNFLIRYKMCCKKFEITQTNLVFNKNSSQIVLSKKMCT